MSGNPNAGSPRIAILGSGPSGLIAAYLLGEKGFEVTVFEASERVGGLAQSIQLWGQFVELGPHFLDVEGCAPLRDLVFELFQKPEVLFFERRTRILSSLGTFTYPPTLRSLLAGMSASALARSAISFLIGPASPAGNAEEAMSQTMGRFLYSRFFQGYSEKLWGVPCRELDECYSSAMLPFKGGGSILKKLFLRRSAPPVHVYFEGGMSTLWERIHAACVQRGMQFRLRSRATHCACDGGAIRLTDSSGVTEEYARVLSTLPGRFNRSLFDLPPQPAFAYRHAILVYLLADRAGVLDAQCLYLYSPEIVAVRVTDFSNFPTHTGNSSILLVEYWVGADGLWEAGDAEIVKVAMTDLEKVAAGVSITATHVKKVPFAYRIPHLGLPEKIAREGEELERLPFHAIGRSNSPYFNYGMDSAVAEAAAFCATLAP